MLRLCIAMIGLLAFSISARQAAAITVTINTDSAKAVLVALENPSLTHEDALKIARMTGNQGIIREMNGFKISVTIDSFANALWAAAHGQKATDPTETSLYFDIVKPKAAQLLALTNQIEANPQAFQEPIERRIALFTPPGSEISLQGYIIAGGDGGGYAFGGTDFYLNLEFNEDMAVAKTVTTHELYHAVQAAFAAKSAPAVEAQQSCANTARLLADIYREGSAMLVEDSSTLAQSHSESATRQLTDINDGLAHLKDSATLLELSVLGLNASEAVPFDDVYSVGFYGHGVLYDIGNGMARAIVENDGPQGLALFLKQPPYKFALRYTQLPKYGGDKNHPRLGPNTVKSLNQLATGCK
jgi:hypothetical protein